MKFFAENLRMLDAILPKCNFNIKLFHFIFRCFFFVFFLGGGEVFYINQSFVTLHGRFHEPSFV